MSSERGIELSKTNPSRLSVRIETPSGALSMPKKHWPIAAERIDARAQRFWIVSEGLDLTDETALALIACYTREMMTWNNYEAWIILFEDGKEISREHICRP